MPGIVRFFVAPIIATVAFVGTTATTALAATPTASTATTTTTTPPPPPMNMLVMYAAHKVVADPVRCTGVDVGPGSSSWTYVTDYVDPCYSYDHTYSCDPMDCGGVISDGTLVRFEPYMSFDRNNRLRSEQQFLLGWRSYAYVNKDGSLSNWDYQNWDGSPLPLTEAGEHDGHMVTLQLQFATAAVYWQGHDVCTNDAVDYCSFK